VISVPLKSIKRVYAPKDCLRSLVKLKRKDDLQKMTVDLIGLLSNASGIMFEDFGVHGSVALSMHASKSDIDIVVYGSDNFRKLERAVGALVKEGTLSYQSKNRLDAIRHFKGRYMNRVFMYNGVRKPEEINQKYGRFRYSPVAAVEFFCTVKDDSEAMFRPAIYRIDNYRPASVVSELSKQKIPQFVVSMIGCYRNVARRGGTMMVNGMLERVEDLETASIFHQVVVGSATSEEERICPA
jgi:predicted nucleotidyltransferase